MRKLAVIILFHLTIMFFYSCEHNYKMYNKVIYREFREIDNGNSVQRKKYFFQQDIGDDGTYLHIYKNSKDTTLKDEYVININRKIGQQKSNTKIEELYYDTSAVFEAIGREYRIYKFIANKNSIDGEFTIFWSADLGIIIARSNTWRNFSKLISTENDSLNKVIDILCDMVLNDTDFYKNKIPKSNIDFIEPKVK